MTALLGIDYGTTGFKVRLFDAHGAPLAGAGSELPAQSPAPGWVEQDVSKGWEAVCVAIRATLREARVRSEEVLAVSTTGTYNLTVLNHAGRILRPAILYGDTRLPPPEDIQTILRELGAERVAALFGFKEFDEGKLKIVLRILRSSKLLWLRAHDPEVYARIQACMATSMDFINARLTGKVAHLTDGIALDDDIAELFGIPHEWFGEAYEAGQVVGHINAQGAVESGLAEGTPVVMAAGDSSCSFLGAGLVRPGIALNLAGTTDVVAVAVGERPQTNVGYPVEHLIPGLWLVSLSPLRGPAIRWLRDNLLPAGATYADIDDLAGKVPPGAQGLLCLPYLSGEKGVVHDPDARGMLVGLDTQHQRGHIARAVLEGIAFGLREILEAYQAEGVPVEEVRLAGGGARSRLWNQIRADVLGRPVNILRVLEAGCLGAAVLAAVAVGLYRDRYEGALAMARVAESLQPDPAHAEIYQEVYRLYKQLYPANCDLVSELAKLRVG